MQATRPTFRDLKLPEGLLTKVERLGFEFPTPIQAEAIPIALEGRDLIGIAQTGTGKTFAFALPMMANLPDGETGLVLAPTRELAGQIEAEYLKLGASTACLVGGANMARQVHSIRQMPEVIVATPGRLMDHLEHGNLSLRSVGIVALDEADRMLDLGFAPAIKFILDQTFPDRMTWLFSATMPKSIEDLANTYLNHPARIEMSRPGSVVTAIEQEVYVTSHDDKHDLLNEVLDSHDGSVLTFTRTRAGAAKLTKKLRMLGHKAAEIHADRTLAQRAEALKGFKQGLYRVLVATDIAARGIDVQDIALVVNYDVPENPEDYVHRIGRTGRAGAMGKAMTFATPDQWRDLDDIERLTKVSIPLSPNSKLEFQRPTRSPSGWKRKRPGKHYR